MNNRICIGRIAAPHGIKGLVKLTIHADDPKLAQGVVFTSENDSKTIEITLKNSMGKFWLAEIKGVNDRNASEDIKGTQLYIAKDRLPEIEEEDSFYFADLEGLKVFDRESQEIGTVRAVHNYGAGDLLDIRLNEAEDILLPFTKECVPTVDIKAGTIIICIPEEIEEEETKDEQQGE